VTPFSKRVPSGFGGGGGKLDVATVYETYSLSFLVVRSSGSLPRRPMRTSFARSYDRAGVEENVRRCKPDSASFVVDRNISISYE